MENEVAKLPIVCLKPLGVDRPVIIFFGGRIRDIGRSGF